MEDAMPTHRRTFPGHPQELRTARNWIRTLLDGHPHADDAALIVTELGSNALRHSSSSSRFGSFHLTLIQSPNTVAIAVTDMGGSTTAPHIEKPDENDPHGRGLSLVTTLADRVEVHGDNQHGHTVTAELHLIPKPRTIPAQGATTC
jgi:anti-sigma regulatory factor (Ser/Thr protein kinase)